MRRLGVLVCVAMLGLGGAADAEGITFSGSSAATKSSFKDKTRLIDKRLARQYSGAVRLMPKPPADDAALPRFTGSYRGEYLELARAAARRHNVPEDLFLRLVQQESGWNPGAVSVKGATGLAQLMPDTARLLGVDMHDPRDNLDGGARYLRMMYDKFGSWRLALAAYNAGPGAVEQHDGIPPFDETQNYVKVILGG
ncbi:MAG TPA: lytic transglycosylase domain-containing protein [Paracoccaceae bacterium]|nr:lytic transglycosylase domain-containing protein [Paracoccaceae bacterium]